MKKINSAYLAGVADADGSFSWLKHYSKPRKKFYYQGVFQLTWKSSDDSLRVIKLIQGEYGGSFFIGNSATKFGKCPIIKYAATGKALVALCSDVIPYLELKKKQAEIVMSGAALKSDKWGVKGKPQAVWKKEEELYRKINLLNTKNKKYGTNSI